MADSVYSRQVLEAAEAYKDVARKYIYSAPMSAAAYFALFQQIDGLLFFDLYDKNDSKAYGAVATSFDHYYPESPRAKHLYNLALQSIKVIRSQRPMDLDKVAFTGPSSTTCAPMRAINRPSEVPPLVNSCGLISL